MALGDADLRVWLYTTFLATGRCPSVAEMAAEFATSPAQVAAALRRMHDAHMLVLQPSGEVLMANPLSAVPTPFPVLLSDGRMFYGNCIWDALGILAMVGSEGSIPTTCGDCGDALTVKVENGQAHCADPVQLHFALPARQWWDNIVFN